MRQRQEGGGGGAGRAEEGTGFGPLGSFPHVSVHGPTIARSSHGSSGGDGQREVPPHGGAGIQRGVQPGVHDVQREGPADDAVSERERPCKQHEQVDAKESKEEEDAAAGEGEEGGGGGLA